MDAMHQRKFTAITTWEAYPDAQNNEVTKNTFIANDEHPACAV